MRLIKIDYPHSGKALIICVFLAATVGAAKNLYAGVNWAELKPTSVVTNKSRMGTILVESYPPDGEIPRHRVLTPRYDIYSELSEAQIQPYEIGRIVEAARNKYELFFDYGPQTSGERWKLEIYANSARYREAGKRDSFEAVGGGRYMWHTQILYLYWQGAGIAFTRGLIIHEAEHQFHHRSGRDPRTGPKNPGIGSSRFRFVDEGLATFFEGHTWDAVNEALRVGVPNSPTGRAKQALTQMSKRELSFASLIESRKDYPEAWGLMHYLVFNKPLIARRLLADARPPAEVWKDLFGTLDIGEDFISDYKSWLNRMLNSPMHVEFKSWDDLLESNAKNEN